jgi:hypothetical protein
MEFIPTLQRAHQVYLTIAYGYAIYSCVNNYYSSARKVIKVCQTGYILSRHAQHKVAKWWYTPGTKTSPNTKQVELMDITPKVPMTKINLPASLDDAVLEWFVDSPTSSDTPQSGPELQASTQTEPPIK